MKENVRKIIERLASGYSATEVTEEYGVEDGELKLVKRREVKKEIPSDLKAVKLLAEEEDLTAMTDEELQTEKLRLLRELHRQEKEEEES